MFATVGGQLAQYLERRRLQADESRRVEAMLRAERDRAQRYLDVAGTMIVVLDADGAVELLNRTGCEVLGLRGGASCSAATGSTLAVPEHERDARARRFERVIARRGRARSTDHESAVAHARPASARSSPGATRPARRRRPRRSASSRSGEDITERRAAEEQIAHLAYHDPLTGLPTARCSRSTSSSRSRAPARARARGRAALPRPRRLQARQRLARPRAPATSCCAASRAGSQALDARTATCSPATAATSSCSCSPTSPATTATAARARRRRARRARSAEPFDDRGRRVPRRAPASASRSSRATRPTPTSCSSTPTPRCTRPRAAAAAASTRLRAGGAATRSSGSR